MTGVGSLTATHDPILLDDLREAGRGVGQSWHAVLQRKIVHAVVTSVKTFGSGMLLLLDVSDAAVIIRGTYGEHRQHHSE